MTLQELEDKIQYNKETRLKTLLKMEEMKASNDPNDAVIKLMSLAIDKADSNIAKLEAQIKEAKGENKEQEQPPAEQKPAAREKKAPARATRSTRKTKPAAKKTTSETGGNDSSKEKEPAAPKDKTPDPKGEVKLTAAELAAYYQKIDWDKVRKPAKLSWKADISLERLQKLGYIYEVEGGEDTCVQLAIELSEDVECFVKGDATVTAKKGELVIMVHTEGVYFRQFNIVSNQHNCALRVVDSELFNPKVAATSLSKSIAAKKGSTGKKTSLHEVIVKAIREANRKGDNVTDDSSYWGGKHKYQAVAKAVMYIAQMHALGLEPKQIVAILRDKDNRIVFELGELKGKEFASERSFLMLDEKKGKLTDTSKPAKPFGLVDARKSELEKFGKPITDYAPVSQARYLDAIYQGRRIETKSCKQLEKAARVCQSGNCSHEDEKKYLQDLERQCDKAISDPYAKELPTIQQNFETFFKKGYKIHSEAARKHQKLSTSQSFNEANN